MFSTNGFYSLINVYTKLSINNTCSWIDHLFVKCTNNEIINNTEVGVFQVEPTDHYPIITSFNSVSFTKKINIGNNTHKCINYYLLKSRIEDKKSKNVYNENNKNIAVNILSIDIYTVIK